MPGAEASCPVRDRTCHSQVSVSRTGSKCCPDFPSAPKDTVDGPQVSSQQDVAEKLEDMLSEQPSEGTQQAPQRESVP